MKADNGGLRHNKGKVMLHLLPPDALLEVARVYTAACTPTEEYPEGKYPKRNWERGMDYSNVTDSLERHLLAFKMGENKDKESGLLHAAHMVWNALALLTYQLRGIGNDDRHRLAESVVVKDWPYKVRAVIPDKMDELQEKLHDSKPGTIIEVISALMETIKYSPPVRDVRASKEDNFHLTGSDVAPVERTKERILEVGRIFTCYPDKPRDRWKITKVFDYGTLEAQSLRDPTRVINMHQNSIWHIFDKEEIATEEKASHRCMHCSSDALPEKQTCAECGE